MLISRKFYLALAFLFISLVSSAWALEQSTLVGLGSSQKVHAQLIMPNGKGPFPAVLLLHGNSGVKKEDLAYAKSLAQHGYACLVPYYFDAYSIDSETKNWALTAYAENILDDFNAEIKFLKSRPKINGQQISAVGFAIGGYWALILAAKSKVLAGVAYYGVITRDALDIPMRYNFEDIFTKHSSPVLILHGEDDLTIDVKYAKELAQLLKSRFCKYELHIYPNAGNHFDRGASRHETAAEDSWKRTLSFLKKASQAF